MLFCVCESFVILIKTTTTIYLIVYLLLLLQLKPKMNYIATKRLQC